MGSARVFNFSAGPGTLPMEVLAEAEQGLYDFDGTGMGVMEMSHRSPAFEGILRRAEADLRSAIGIPEGYQVLFLQGGASLQFAQIPMAFGELDYIVTGAWGEKAAESANATPIWTDAENGYRSVPRLEEFVGRQRPIHITTNETIHGVEFPNDPDPGMQIIADASSNILSRPMDIGRYSMIYAGAQKNLGPAGVTVAILRDDLLSRHRDGLPAMLDYRIHVKNRSLYNTPPCWAIYMLGLVLQWVHRQGGAEAMAERNAAKSDAIYGAIDRSGGFYRPHASHRSRMNVVFTLPNAELSERFVIEAAANAMDGLAGHRSVGGIRASLYNAMPVEGATLLANFMDDFARRNG